MNKKTIMNNYAIEQGYESWEDLYIQSDMVFSHFNNVTDLIQEELKKKISESLSKVYFYTNNDMEYCKESILNTEIL